MTYLEALLEAESALRRRLSWYTSTLARRSRPRSQRRIAELEGAIERIGELITAAQEMEQA